MKTSLSSLILLLSLLVPLTVGAYAPRTREMDRRHGLAQALKTIATLDTVDGRRVGYAGQPGRFYEALLKLQVHAKAPDLERLLAEKKPVVRAAALIALANQRGAKADPLLRRHLKDAGRFTYRPSGCVGRGSTVGALAKELLASRYWSGSR